MSPSKVLHCKVCQTVVGSDFELPDGSALCWRHYKGAKFDEIMDNQTGNGREHLKFSDYLFVDESEE